VLVRRDKAGRYRVSALDLPRLAREGPSLEQAKARLAHDLERALGKARAGALARLLSRPRVHLEARELVVETRPEGGKRELFRGRFSVALEEAPGGSGARIASIPSVDEEPRVIVLAARGEEPDEALAKALGRRFAEDESGLADAAIARSERLHVLEVEVGARALADPFPGADDGPESPAGKAGVRSRAELLRAETLLEVGVDLDGEAKQGRLSRAFGRDDEVLAALAALEAGGGPRAVLLVGEPGVGKTAIVHEVTRRLLARREEALRLGEELPRHARGAFTLGAGRLVAGMRYVGQWERRALDLGEEAEALDALLHWESLPEVIRAGRTAADDRTSVASLLAPRIAAGGIAVIAEATPEGLRRAEEDDRPTTRLFHVIRVHEPSRERLTGVLLEAVRALETETRVAFDARALGAAQDLLARFVPYEAFPGKAIRFLRRLAEEARRHRSREVGTGHVLGAFTQHIGVSYAVANDATTIARAAAREWLTVRVRGQPEAVDALADVVVALKSGMKDPEKPLAALLFTGPTGTGKTECAKALASYLFGSEERLLRFDLNEYADAGASERLAGSSYAPEGTLVRALRERPLAVVLLDEVEKADPGVLDLLLQLLGEGRITDALGRTADARNAVFVLTSNLGAESAGRSLGLAAAEAGASQRWVRAVEEFFRPELVNRLDRIVPFRALDAATLEEIAAREVRRMLDREGVKRRRLFLDLAPSLTALLAREGAGGAMGARPLRRAAERLLAAPLAAALAARPAAESVLVRITTGGATPAGDAPLGGEARVEVVPLEGIGPVEAGPRALEVLPAPEGQAHGAWARSLVARFAALERSPARAAQRRALLAASGAASTSDVEPGSVDATAEDDGDRAREERLHRLEQEIELAREELQSLDMGRRRGGFVERAEWRWPPFAPGKPRRPELTLSLAWTPTPPAFAERLRRAAARLALLERVVETSLEPAERVLVRVRCVGDGAEHWAQELVSLYGFFFARHGSWPLDVPEPPEDPAARRPGPAKAHALLVEHPLARALLEGEAGLHEARYPRAGDATYLASVQVAALAPGDPLLEALAALPATAPLDGLAVVRKYVAGEFVHDTALGRSAPSSREDDDEDLHEELRAAFHEVMVLGYLSRALGLDVAEEGTLEGETDAADPTAPSAARAEGAFDHLDPDEARP